MNNELIILSGIDIVNNNRIKKLIQRSPHALKDIFSSKEIEYCSRKKYSEQSFGARFAVKEAILKATDSGIFSFELSEIETINLNSGKPLINIYSKSLIEKIKKLLNKDHYQINASLSHEKDYSIAHVLIY